LRGAGGDPAFLIPSGFVGSNGAEPFTQEQIEEHVAHSWYLDYEGGRHPFQGETQPYASGPERGKYTWAKAPRYHGQPAETGPLAEMVVAGVQPVADLVRRDGPSAFTRQLARLVRPALLLPAMEAWLEEIDPHQPFYASPGEIPNGQGLGLIEAARGALGHWVCVKDGRIAHYQIITPTAWNASPRDSADVCGPIERALEGMAVADPENPIELGMVVRSFDPCLVCTCHTVSRRGEPLGRIPVGAAR
jgi:hydrogenase large subunit